MNKCMAADKPCTCQPTAGNVCADVRALRKYAERYLWMRDSGRFITAVGGGQISGEQVDQEVDAMMVRVRAIGATPNGADKRREASA